MDDAIREIREDYAASSAIFAEIGRWEPPKVVGEPYPGADDKEIPEGHDVFGPLDVLDRPSARGGAA